MSASETMANRTTRTVRRPLSVSPTLLLLLLLSVLLMSGAAVAVPFDGGGGGDDGVKPVYRLLVLHTNDMHSRFEQTDRIGSQCVDRGPVPRCYGGFARLKTAVDTARAEAQASGTTDGTLFLNAGDTFQGTAIYTYLKWAAVARMVSWLGIDAMSLGNHEFDDGVEDVRLFIHNITIPVVTCNLDLSGEPSLAKEPNLMKSKVFTINGRKIGIIGYLTPETTYLGIVGNIKILPEIPSITAEAKRLKNKGVNILIALGHSGFDVDKQIAEEVDDIDLVVGGHTNTFLFNGNPPDIEEPVGPYPFLVKQPRTNREVPVIQASHITKYLGKLWLEFDEAGELIRSYGNPVLLDYTYGQDLELTKQIDELEKIIDVNTKQVIGSTSVFLEGIDMYCRIRECNLGDLVTDSFIDHNLRINMKSSSNLTKSWTDAPIAIIQSGGIRSNINHLSRIGNITFGDLLLSLPFRNDVGKITTKGSDIWNALEFSVRRYDDENPHGEFLQVSGLRVVIDLGQPSGSRVQSVHARCGDCSVPVYHKLNLDGDYTIVMTNYMASGGDGFTFTKIVGYKSFKISEMDIVREFIALKSPMWPEVGQRTILLNADKLRKTVSGSSSTGGGRDQFSTSGLSNCLLMLTVIVAIVVDGL